MLTVSKLSRVPALGPRSPKADRKGGKMFKISGILEQGFLHLPFSGHSCGSLEARDTHKPFDEYEKRQNKCFNRTCGSWAQSQHPSRLAVDASLFHPPAWTVLPCGFHGASSHPGPVVVRSHQRTRPLDKAPATPGPSSKYQPLTPSLTEAGDITKYNFNQFLPESP